MRHKTKTGFATNRDLISRCVLGNRQAKEAFVKRFSDFVYRTVQYTFKNRNVPCGRADIEDLHATVFVKLFENRCRRLSQYKCQNGCSMLSWIRLITVRTVLDHIRKSRTDALTRWDKILPIDAIGELKWDAQGPRALMEQAEQYHLIEAEMTGLVPRDRIFLQLHFLKGYSIGEVAKFLRISDNAAYSVKHRAVKRLKSAVRNREKRDAPETAFIRM